jgi:transposase-like protein
MEFPKTLIEFQERFSDEASCWAFVRGERWPRGFVCPRCGSRGSHFVQTRCLEQCRRCRYQASVTAGTVLHGTRVPLRVWLLAMFFLGRHKKGISALQFQKDAGLGSYQTAWTLLHKLRSGLFPRASHRLTGAVEADETYIGGYQPGHLGRGVGKTGVAVAVERRRTTAGAVRLAVVGRASTEELTSFVRGAIDARKATVFTDAWQGYTALISQGVRHRPRVGGHGPGASDLLPWAHTVFGNLKTWLQGTFHGVSPKHLQRYLDEFVYRFDRRWIEAALSGFVLRRAVQAQPFPYHRLTAEPVG